MWMSKLNSALLRKRTPVKKMLAFKQILIYSFNILFSVDLVGCVLFLKAILEQHH